MGFLWKVAIKPDQSVEFTAVNEPSISLIVNFEGPHDVEERLELNPQGGGEFKVYGKLRVRSRGTGGDSYGIAGPTSRTS